VSELPTGGGPLGRVCQPKFLHSGKGVEIANPPIVPAIRDFFFEPWHALCRQIATGGLRCPDLSQRRQASFSLVALCVQWP
jgi:hypothetical protein